MSHVDCDCFACMTQEITRTTPLHKLVKRQFHPYMKQILHISSTTSKRPRKLKSYIQGNTLWLDFVELAQKKRDLGIELVDQTDRVFSICEDNLRDMNVHIYKIHVLNLPITDTLQTITPQHHNSLVRIHGIVCKVEQVVEHSQQKSTVTCTDIADPSRTFTAWKYGEVVVAYDKTHKTPQAIQTGQHLDITGVWNNIQTCVSINVILLLPQQLSDNAET